MCAFNTLSQHILKISLFISFISSQNNLIFFQSAMKKGIFCFVSHKYSSDFIHYQWSNFNASAILCNYIHILKIVFYNHLQKSFLKNLLSTDKLYRVASGPGNLEKSRNFNMKLGKVREFYLPKMYIPKIFSKFIQVVNKN